MKAETVDFYWGRLPHWEVLDRPHFITICLHGAIPPSAAQEIRREAEELKRLSGGDSLKVRRFVFHAMEKWLDRKDAPRDLAVKGVAEMLMEAIRHRETIGLWRVIEFVVMPSHLHLFVHPLRAGLFRELKEMKRWTGHRATQWVATRKPFWGREWFDHWLRPDDDSEKTVRYIRDNPVKAGLVREYREWPYGGW